MFQKLKYTSTSKGIIPLVLVLSFLFGFNLNAQNLKETEKLLSKNRFKEAKKSINKLTADSLNLNKYYPFFVKGKVYLGDYQNKLNASDYLETSIQLLDTAYKAYSYALKLIQNDSLDEFPLELVLGLQNTSTHYNNRGVTSFESTKYEDAILNIEKSIKVDSLLNKQDTTKYYNCFAISSTINDSIRTQFYGTLLIDRFCFEKENVFGVVIQSFIKQNKTIIADKYLNQAISLFPNNNNFKLLQVNLAIDKNDPLESVIRLEEILKRESNNVFLLNTVANFYLNVNKPISATKYFTKIIELDSSNFNANLNLGIIYFNEAVELNNSNSDSNMEVDNLFNKSLPYFLIAHSLKSNNKTCKESLKLIYSKLGGYDSELKSIEAKLLN